MKKIEHIYLYTCLSIISAGGILLGYWYLIPVEALVVKNPTAVKVDKEVYQAGDRLTYTLEYCKNVDVSGTIQRSLVDGIRINYVAYYNKLPTGCGKINNADLVIPDFVGTGIYHLETTVEYKVNPVKTVYVSWRSMDFKIENKSNDKTQLENHEAEDSQKFDELFKKVK